MGQQAWRLLSELVLVLPQRQQVWLVPQGLESLLVWLEQPLLGEESPQVLRLVWLALLVPESLLLVWRAPSLLGQGRLVCCPVR